MKEQNILKNQIIYCLEIIKTKQNIYDYTIEKYKRKMGYVGSGFRGRLSL